MTTIHLVRHAVHDLVDHVLVGRNAAVGLSEAGRAQARDLGQWFARRPIDSVQSSPQPRARQTAEPIAKAHGLTLETAPAFDELDMGKWTGRPFDTLQSDPEWHRWNVQREVARPPSGESIAELTARVVPYLEQLNHQFGGGHVVVVSHAEPIRTALLHYLGRSPNDFSSIRVDPASVTTLRFSGRSVDVTQDSERSQDIVAA